MKMSLHSNRNCPETDGANSQYVRTIPTNGANMVQSILRRADVERATGLPRSTIYEMMARGVFPKPIRLSARAVGWIEAEILEWQKVRIATRDEARAA